MTVVGRDRELAALRAFLAACPEGPSAFTIEGESGIGKTALFDAALAGASGMCILRVRCVDTESGLSYAGLADLLGDVVEATAPRLPPPQRRALEIALLRADNPGEPVQPHAVGRAVLGVLRLLAADQPVLIAIDDAQWLDPASAGALRFAVRRVDAAPVSLLATRRSPGGAPPAALDDAVSPARRHRVVVRPLTATDVGELLDRRFAAALPAALQSRVQAMAAGNPLYAIELAAAHLASGRSAADPLTFPVRLEELLAARLARLPEAATQPVAAVAALAAPTVALVVAALGADARAGLDAALDEHVLRVSEGRLWFSHPLLAMAALHRLAPSARRVLHRRLAAAVTDDEERGRHLVLAADGPDAVIAAAAEAAADLARSRGAPMAAALMAEAAIRLTPPGQAADIGRRQVAAAYHRVTAGDVSRGRAHMAAARDAAPPGPLRAQLSWRLGMVTHLDGDLGAAVRLLENARAEAGDDRALVAEATYRLAGLYTWQGRLDDSTRCWRAALRWARAAGDRRAELEALPYGFGALLTGAVGLVELRHRTDELAAAVGPWAPLEDPAGFVAQLHMIAGEAGAAVHRLEPLYKRAAERGDEIGQAAVSGLLAQAELAAGNWPRARRLAYEVARSADHVPIVRTFGMDLYTTALIEAHLGNVEPARTAATALVEHAGRRGLVPLLHQGQTVLGFLALSGGDARTAHAHFATVIDGLRQLGIREWGVVHLVWSDLDALVELGELDQAEALAAEMRGRAETLGRRPELAAAHRGHGLVLAARGDATAAQEALTCSVAEYERLDWPFERARTLLARGVVLRRGKQKRAAREALHQALAVFDRLGARLWAVKTSQELARIGGRTPAGSLTTGEQRVASLVADGNSNRQVADQLFLSAKTVAGHLTSIYAKLGVRSRAELARRLRDR